MNHQDSKRNENVMKLKQPHFQGGMKMTKQTRGGKG